MICFNCGKCFTTDEIATLSLRDENENILEKKILCYECAKLLALALIKKGMGDK
jgi:hypothetical protein